MHEAPPSLPFRRAGRSGLSLPVVSLGLWQNFGSADALAAQRSVVFRAIERGAVHLDLANNYGPPAGAAEENAGRLLAELRGHREELVVATKAGYRMGAGPYQEGGSRKYLVSSLDASLRRLGLDHVDVFYSHRFDPTTPLAETVGALATAVQSGRARYAGISSYSPRRTREALDIARRLGVPLALTQNSYAMLNRWIELPDETGDSLLTTAAEGGLGVVAFSPLAQGMLTDRYLDGIPRDSRAARGGSLRADFLSPENLRHVRRLDALARARGQSLAQTAIAWAARDPRVTSVVIGARTVAQLDENLDALSGPAFTAEELALVDSMPADAGVNIWAARSSDL